MKNCIVWDWNGTLLDDVEVALQARNAVFPSFGVPILEDLEKYRNIFTFPVKKYYLESGIQESDYEEVAQLWFDEYSRLFQQAKLRKDVNAVLQALKQKNVSQIILSASKLDLLEKQLEYFAVRSIFDDVLALQDIHARDKSELAKSYFANHNYDNIIVVGDTSHDYSVANVISARMLFINNGHESEEKLKKHGQKIIASLWEVLNEV